MYAHKRDNFRRLCAEMRFRFKWQIKKMLIRIRLRPRIFFNVATSTKYDQISPNMVYDCYAAQI